MFSWFRRLRRPRQITIDVPWHVFVGTALAESRCHTAQVYDLRCPRCRTAVLSYHIRRGIAIDVTLWPHTDHQDAVWWNDDGDWFQDEIKCTRKYDTNLWAKLTWCRACLECEQAFAFVDVKLFDRAVTIGAWHAAQRVGAQMACITNTSEKQQWLGSCLLYQLCVPYEDVPVGVEGYFVGPFDVEMDGPNRRPQPSRRDWVRAVAIVKTLISAHGGMHRLRFPRGNSFMSAEARR